uniref:TRAM domain-containing protein n=1 Tax=viral metagenome TaxID=1070528 RepID=A0A6M3JRG8_9ZZZZ
MKGDRIQVRAIRGKEGSIVSRLPDGKIVLFSKIDPLSANIKINDVVEGEIMYDTSKYIVLKPNTIISTTEPILLEGQLHLDADGSAFVNIEENSINEYRGAIEDGKKVRVEI